MRLASFVALLALLPMPASHAQSVSLGLFEGHADVGTVSLPGSAAYDASRDQYVIAGSVRSMTDRDDFHFVWKKMAGNFILSMRGQLEGNGVEAHRRLGWTIRPTLAADAPHVTAALHGNGMVSLQTRRAAGGMTEQFQFGDSVAGAMQVLQIERRDGVYIMSTAVDGDTLVAKTISDVTLPDTVYVGLYVCAHNDTVLERAYFSNVRITIPAKRDFVPYRDYIGSRLEVLDIASGNARVVHTYEHSFQAPQYTADGKALVYAQDGLIYRFDLATAKASVVPTGFATRNNNDHVFSWDGKWLGISNFMTDEGGRSIIHIVPAGGGTPRRVTPSGPSYLHGWSPDQKWLVYAGQRDGKFDIYRISVNGGPEIRLTDAPGVNDGPEYTPDGRWIYFNSARTGLMQIWRMKPDGSGQEQVTSDHFNNWFPHISPDGQWFTFISFPPDIPPEDHPFYKHTYIQLMPIDGGKSKVIAYVYGGQGTINVPSWSPDGRSIAFVSNTELH